jgi:tetratricopeptide (TPR) repeat protein
MIALTEKNQDTKARASNYALMSLLHWRQFGNKDSANYFLEKAIALDPSNPYFEIQKGDMLVDEKKYDDAFEQYDKAVEMGKADLEMYQIRTNARMRMVSEKYKTTNAQELRSKMSAEEKKQVCTELNKAISLGMKDMKQDMFASMVCKQ